MSAPVLTVDDNPNLYWVWDGVDPDHWNIQQNGPATGGWFDYTAVPGSERRYNDLNDGISFRLFGEDVDNNPITPTSNVVVSP